MLKRVISSCFIFLVFFFSIFFYPLLFRAIIVLIFIAMVYEWFVMVGKRCSIDLLIGTFFISLSFFAIIYIILIDSTGKLIFSYFCSIWSVDIFAMISGKLFSHTKKLAPRVSPNKTWVGFWSGSISCSIVLFLLHICGVQVNSFFNLDQRVIIISAIPFGMISQLSDLFVSFFKRRFNIKDTGHIIPGHGGVLDRFDSIILTAPTLVIFLLLCNL